MQARYYDPTFGRFLSTDPVQFMDNGDPVYFNRYAYVGNDPINKIDPDGRCSASAVTAGGIAAGADGPLPIGDAVGVAVVAGSCIYRGVRTIIGVARGIITAQTAADKLIDSTKKTDKGKRSGKTQEREKEGSFEDANEDFDDIVDPDSVEDKGDGIRTGNEKGGNRKIIVRPNSKSDPGKPTIEIQDGKKRIKIRYREPSIE